MFILMAHLVFFILTGWLFHPSAEHQTLLVPPQGSHVRARSGHPTLSAHGTRTLQNHIWVWGYRGQTASEISGEAFWSGKMSISLFLRVSDLMFSDNEKEFPSSCYLAFTLHTVFGLKKCSHLFLNVWSWILFFLVSGHFCTVHQFPVHIADFGRIHQATSPCRRADGQLPSGTRDCFPSLPHHVLQQYHCKFKTSHSPTSCLHIF